MWIFFGFSAILTAILNISWWALGREAKYFRFLSLSLTALTVCTFYAQATSWTMQEDWSALTDVLPGVSVWLWFLTIASIFINALSLIPKDKK